MGDGSQVISAETFTHSGIELKWRDCQNATFLSLYLIPAAMRSVVMS